MRKKSLLIVPEKIARPMGYLYGASVLAGNGKNVAESLYDGAEGIGEVGSAAYNVGHMAIDAVRGIGFAEGISKYGHLINDWTYQASTHAHNLGNNALSLIGDPVDFATKAGIALGAVGIGIGAKELLNYYRTEGRGGIITRLKRRFGRNKWPVSDFDK